MQPEIPHFSFPFRRSKLVFTEYNPAENYLPGEIVKHEDEFYRATQPVARNLLKNPSGEAGTTSVHNPSSSGSTAAPVNLIPNPSGEAGVPIANITLGSSPGPVNLVANPSGETGTPSAAGAAGASPLTNQLTNPSLETNTTGWSAANGGTLTRVPGMSRLGVGNFCANPSFEVNAAEWSPYANPSGTGTPSGGRVTGDGVHGGACFETTVTGLAEGGSAQTYVTSATRMPIGPGDRAYVRGSLKHVSGSIGATGDMRVAVRWFNPAGTYLGASTPQQATAVQVNPTTGQWYTLYGWAVAPAGAGFATLDLFCYNRSGATQTVTYRADALVLSLVDTGATYFDGDSAGYGWTGTPHASVTGPSAGHTNLIKNPSFEVDVADWAAGPSGATTLNTWQRQTGWVAPGSGGAASARYSITVNAPGSVNFANATALPGRAPCMPGLTYSARCVANILTSTTQVVFSINWFSASGGFVSTTPQTIQPGVTGVMNLAVSGPAPANACQMNCSVQISNVVGTADLYFDQVQLCQGPQAPYRDGASPGYQWAGTANLSNSVPIPNCHAGRWTWGTTQGCPLHSGMSVGAGETVCYSAWVWIPTSWSGPAASAQFACTDGATIPSRTLVSAQTADNTKRDQWQRIWTAYTNTGSAATPVFYINAGVGFVTGDFAYFDGLQCEILASGTTPSPTFDGNTFGYRWTGTAHASTSTAASAPVTDSTHWAKVGTHSSRHAYVTRTDTVGVTLNGSATGTGAIPVTANNWYAARVTGRVDPQTVGTIYSVACRMYWYDAVGAALISVTGPATTPVVDTGHDTFVIGQAPANAAFVLIAAYWNPQGTPQAPVTCVLNADAYALYDMGATAPPSSGPTTNEAHVPAYFDGTSPGYVWNGTANASTSRPASATVVDTTAWARYGTHATRYTVVRTDTAYPYIITPSNTIPVTPGNWYSARCSIRVDPSTVGNLLSLYVRIYWYKSAGVGATPSTSTGPTIIINPVKGTGYDCYVIGQAPADANFGAVTPVFTVPGSIQSPVVSVIDIDGYMLADMGTTAPPSSEGTTNPADVIPYFDGSFFGFAWNGTANASTSRPLTATVADTTAWAKHGTHASRYTVTRNDGTSVVAARTPAGLAGSVPVIPGHYYASRCAARLATIQNLTPGGLVTADGIYAFIYWYTAAGATASTGAAIGLGTLDVPTGVVTDVVVIGQAPDNAAFGTPACVLNFPSGLVTMVADVDAFTMVDLGADYLGATDQSTNPVDVPLYADGSTPGYVWLGTPNNSISQPLDPNDEGTLWDPGVEASQLSMVEQDTETHVMGCVERIMRCPVGFRLERPEFGIPWPEYRTNVVPMLQTAIGEFEDRASITDAVVRDPETADATVTVEVEVTDG